MGCVDFFLPRMCAVAHGNFDLVFALSVLPVCLASPAESINFCRRSVCNVNDLSRKGFPVESVGRTGGGIGRRTTLRPVVFALREGQCCAPVAWHLVYERFSVFLTGHLFCEPVVQQEGCVDGEELTVHLARDLARKRRMYSGVLKIWADIGRNMFQAHHREPSRHQFS